MDQKLFFLINREWSSPTLDPFMATLSSFDFWIPILLALIVCVAIFGGFRARAMILTIGLTVALTDGVVVDFLKHAVNRPRPMQVLAARVVTLKKIKPRLLGVLHPPVVKTSHPKLGTIEGRSFPSGHVSNNFAVAMVLAAFYRRRGWLYFFVAAAIGYSRIYVAAHWPSDVLVSIFLGCGMGLLCLALAEALWRRWGGLAAPDLRRRHPTLLQPATEIPS